MPEAQEIFSTSGTHTFDMYASEAAPVARSPYASSTLQAELQAQFQGTPFTAPDDEAADPPISENTGLHRPAIYAREDDFSDVLSLDVQSEETARAVSVAIAYFEDTLSAAPEILLSAGPFGADGLSRLLHEQGIAQQDGVRVRDLVNSSALAQTATTAQVPRSWLAGVVGALRS